MNKPEFIGKKPEFPGVREIFWTPRKVRKMPRPTLELSFLLALFAKPLSDPPNYAKVRARRPAADPERYKSLTRDAELELIRAYHEDGDLDALDQLVGAHRPMVVRLARRFARGNPRKLKIFVEYGMLGLIEAAAPPRPSLTKKGAMVGFDPSKYRFSAYARSYAEKMMRTAMPDWEPPQHVINSKMEFDAWAKTPIPESIEGPRRGWTEINANPPFSHLITEDQFGQHQFHDIWRDERQEPAQRPVDPTKRFEQIRWHRALFGLRSVLDYDADVIPLRRKPRPRKTRWTPAEYAAKDKCFAGYWGKLHSFLFVAKDGMEGLRDGDELDPIDSDAAEFMVATFFRNHALNPKLYKLPKEVLIHRWKLARKRYDKRLKYIVKHRGLGTWDKFGAELRLPDYLDDKVTVKRHGSFIPFLSASIYLMRTEIRQYLILLAAGLYIYTMETKRCRSQ